MMVRIHSSEIGWFMTGERMAHGEGSLGDPSRRLFSVDKAKLILQRRPRWSKAFKIPRYWSEYEFSSMDRERDYDASEPIPVIVGWIDGELVVLDGCNRVYQAGERIDEAAFLGTRAVQSIPAFYLTEKETAETEIHC